jgi:prepilin-type N-terminal cleavage/methylation domain-containing protein
MLQKLRGDSKGFTLIELMIVIAIIGILAAIAIPNFIAYRDKAYCGYAEGDAQNTLAALSSYFSEPDRTTVPTDVQDLVDAEELSLNNAPTSVAITTANGYTVTVQDDSGRCPRGGEYSASMGGDQGSWAP